MKKKFLVIVSLIVLFVFIDVKAITCEYSADRNGINVILVSNNLGNWDVRPSGSSYSFQIYKDSSISTSKKTCPSTIYYKCDSGLNSCYVADKKSVGSFPPFNFDLTGTLYLKSSSNSGSSGSGSSGNWWGGLTGGNPDCQSIFGDLLEFLESYVFSPIRYLTPIVLVVLTSIDFAKAVFADEKEGMKKAQSNFIKRAVAALLIFLAPTIVGIILSLLDNASTKDCLNSMALLIYR